MPALSAFEHKLLKHVRQLGLLSPGDRVVVAVSGGADSVALLQVLSAWRDHLDLTLAVAHVDHGLRGKESLEDATFVEQLAGQLGLPFFLKQLNLKSILGKRKGESVQAVAREKRYTQLQAVTREWGGTKVAVGHTQDDQAETVLLSMLRGAGLAGLSGMPSQREPCVIRPFLTVSRPEILSYLDEKRCEFRVDSSNDNPKYTRNRLRRELIPLLKTFNPNIVSVLSRQAVILREEHQYLDEAAKAALESVEVSRTKDRVVWSRSRLLTFPVSLQRRMILLMVGTLWVKPSPLGFETVETLLQHVVHGTSGSSGCFAGLEAVRQYDRVTFVKAGRNTRLQHGWSCVWPFPGSVRWPVTGQTIVGRITVTKTIPSRRNDSVAYLDADRFSHELVVRSWKPGDYFFPYGMGGRRKKLQDFFSDAKIYQADRSAVPLVVAPEGILWVGGYRSDHRFRVTEETRRVAVVRIRAAGRKA
ncbi:MAG: tRNA lysidine(34) synthetase TilS [Nitrospira sp. SB0662_bin_26]|nr:tRNA lysidine(34) synthetase TilS [Nitrospira sp. SB0662_bin_26]